MAGSGVGAVAAGSPCSAALWALLVFLCVEFARSPPSPDFPRAVGAPHLPGTVRQSLGEAGGRFAPASPVARGFVPHVYVRIKRVGERSWLRGHAFVARPAPSPGSGLYPVTAGVTPQLSSLSWGA